MGVAPLPESLPWSLAGFYLFIQGIQGIILEEILTDTGIIGDSDYERVSHKFTPEECNRLENIIKTHLKQFRKSEKDIFSFFFLELEDICQWLLWMKASEHSKIDHRGLLSDMLKSFKQSAAFIEQIKEMRIYLPMQKFADMERMRVFSNEEEVDPIFLKLFGHTVAAESSVMAAHEATDPLNRLIELTEKYQVIKTKKAGPPQHDTTTFIQRFAGIYKSHFGQFSKPSQYREGLFFELIVTIFEILDIPDKDPSRAIKAALKKSA